ncbi:unnamed protein product [Spirodela intermedia]|uniref:Uncharacterized protein n=1 Tax=Spirodela intermedia TaxID=51605 RepID=A0A7I8JLZ0_SPIIN|nr:unnamed protein product [Spirodela intermedia]CAA6670811.1 unnamed protein product [Spirodela intermedia]
MGDDETMTDFTRKLSRVVTQIRNLGEKLEEGAVVAKLLRATPGRFNPITASLEQFDDIDSMPFEEVVRSLKIYEEKLKSHQQKMKNNRGHGRGRRHGRGRGRSNERGSDENWKPREKSIVKCYNYDKMGHYASECYAEKKEKAHLTKIEEKAESMLLMATLLQGTMET